MSSPKGHIANAKKLNLPKNFQKKLTKTCTVKALLIQLQEEILLSLLFDKRDSRLFSAVAFLNNLR